MKSFFIACMVLCGWLFSTQQGAAQNLITDGDFTTTSSITPLGAPPVPLNTWCSWNNLATVSAFDANITGGVCRFSFLNSGNTNYDVQLIQYGFTLTPGFHYRLSFDVKADAPRYFGVYFGEEGGSWTNLNTANYIQSAGTDWQTRVIDVDVLQTFALNKLSFDLGAENVPMYFDNVVLEKMEALLIPSIEIIGSAVPPYDWNTGVNMSTTDGVHYTLHNFTMPAGEAKFRQDQNWGINWGSSNFPSGTGYQGGPNIPILPGTYDITFNRLTGQYAFTCPTCPPAIGIIGSAVPPYNWSTDVKMSTSDGIIYRLVNYALAGGELRFRQDDSWNMNWGGNSFPTGVGDMYAANIQVIPGNYDITFNRITAAYEFVLKIPSVGILGDALIGWNDDIDMQTTDGVNYTLENQVFTQGEVKFRQDNSWSVNWGDIGFPWGNAYRNGPNIPVPAGKYNVFFNRIWGNYYFQLICPDPVLVCPENIAIAADQNICGAFVTYITPAPADNCGNNYVYQIEGLPSGSLFPVGTTTNTYGLYSMSSGKFTTCSFTVTVKDMEPPVISNASTSVTSLWPANHKMVEVKVNYNLSDNCIIIDSSIVVSSNEPENGLGDGDTAPDWKVINHHLVQLRAERSGNGKGRIYTITIKAMDVTGNVVLKTLEVLVPHDASGKHVAEVVTSKILNARVTPNPSAHYFNLQINTGSAEKISIRVLDMSGRMISSMNAEKNQSVRFGEDLKPGIYMVEIIQGTQKTMSRVVKQ